MNKEYKIKHLEFIQSTITRMASNSFLIKAWSLTLVSAVFVLAGKDGNPKLIPVAFLPSVVFWFLDAFFLRQERLFRHLYDYIRLKTEDQVDFSMDTSPFVKEKNVDYWNVMFSISLRWYYGVLILLVAVALAIILVF